MNYALDDRMKTYENLECDRKVMPLLPVLARLDGRSFHSFTKGLDKPDYGFNGAMANTTRRLMQESNALVGYTQSDEITLCWLQEDMIKQIFFDGRIFKMVSVLAGMCATIFQDELLAQPFGSDSFRKRVYENKGHLRGVFDCRVWQMPNLGEATNAFVWREMDATRNSVAMIAQKYFSHKELQGVSTKDQKKMLLNKGVDWTTYPSFFTHGTFFVKRKITRKFTPEETTKLPTKHEYWKNKDLKIERQDVVEADFKSLVNIANKVDVLFYNMGAI